MLDRTAMQALFARLDGTIPGWCAEHGVDEDALELLIRTYCQDEAAAVAALVAFRLGVDFGESRGVRGTPARKRNGHRYAVQFVVVDRLDGTPMAPVAEEDLEDADQIAYLLNEVPWPDT